MTTPNDVQNEINSQIVPNGRGAITATVLAGVLTAIVGLFALYAPLNSPALTGTPTVNGIPIGAGNGNN